MRSYDKKIKNLKAKLHKKGEQLSKIESEYKYLRKEYHDYCELEVNRRFKKEQILVYEVNEKYKPYYKTIFAFGGTNKGSVEKYGDIDLPSDCHSRLGNIPICSACEYEKIRPANEEEINRFLAYFLKDAYYEKIEKYYDILTNYGVKEGILDELIWSQRKKYKTV